MSFFNTNVDNLLRNDLELAYEDMAFGGNYMAVVGLMKKEDKNGDAIKVPLKQDIGAGQGTVAATAYANATLATRQAFVVTPFKTYGMSIVPLDQDAWTKGDNSVVDLLLDESKTAMDSAKRQTDAALCSDGYGTLGTISSHAGTTPNFTVVLTLASSINRFSVGQILSSAAVAASGGLDSGTATVAAINAATKTLSLTAAGGWTPTDTHVLGTQGTLLSNGSFTIWPGIPAWIPPAASRPAAALFGVTRTNDERRLAGNYLDNAGNGILEGINTLAYQIADVPGSNPDLIVCSYSTLAKINAKLQTERRYVEEETKGVDIDVYYKTVVIQGPKGPMNIVASSNWDNNLVAVLDKSTWVMGAPGNKPFVPATSTGSPVVEIPGADSVVVQYRAQAAVYCVAPGYNGMLTIKAS
jgi:hypothetical protein